MLFAGALAVAGFIGLTAFDGKTLAQQKEEIAAAVTAKLETLRSEKAAECDTRVQTEATTRFEAWKAEQAAAPAPAKGGTKKGGSKGPKVDPLPTGSKPAPGNTAEDKAKGRMGGQSGTKDEEAAKSRMQSAPVKKEEENKAKGRMGGGKTSGGGK